jgi:hypothetical protein
MHNWEEKGVDWDGINDSAEEIGKFISRWGRIGVHQTKEKYGTVRVYCHFGIDSIYQIIFPRRMWVHLKWPYSLDLSICRVIMPVLNRVILPYQHWIYRKAYAKAVKNRPHLREEILCCADFGELLEGVAKYKHSDYWTKY